MPFAFHAGEYPEAPGCYLMKNAAGRIIYVGKSKNLRSRLRSYFQQRKHRKRILQLVQEIAAIEVVLVNNEPESLLLENNLIKIHKPHYNRALKKDNSGYAYLQLTAEPIPRMDVFYRKRKPAMEHQAGAGAAAEAAASTAHLAAALKPLAAPTVAHPSPAAADGRALASAPAKPSVASDAAKEQRFGPYPNSRFRNAVLEFVTDHFRLRTCVKLPKRACLLYHIGKCSGVCEGMISEEAYRETANQAAELLVNNSEDLIAAMYSKMSLYAERLEFEKAESMLRHIRILERMPAKQIVDREIIVNQDVLYFGEGKVLIAKVQEGMLRDFYMQELDLGIEETAAASACDSFLISHYRVERPDELIVNRITDPGKVRASLRAGGNKPVRITQPKRGLKYDLLQLCKNNYEYRMQRDLFTFSK
ncbi:GIY-YIG nuclease family protein [Paenibacillus agricola]|uniref:GIY-YIG nuclease family protein n=1 Tax=Paenibacillus agricola TaxID=2716264 RepID=UPI001FB5B811|nr:GIY-YIG nuclease family protein [Paenibacillus agricola]